MSHKGSESRKRWVLVKVVIDGNGWKFEMSGSGCVIGWKSLAALLTAALTLMGAILYRTG